MVEDKLRVEVTNINKVRNICMDELSSSNTRDIVGRFINRDQGDISIIQVERFSRRTAAMVMFSMLGLWV